MVLGTHPPLMTPYALYAPLDLTESLRRRPQEIADRDAPPKGQEPRGWLDHLGDGLLHRLFGSTPRL